MGKSLYGRLPLALLVATLLLARAGRAEERPLPAAPPALLAPSDEDGWVGLAPFGVRTFAQRTKGAGGDGATRVKAVDAGLAWLATHQRPDGAWQPAELGWCRGVEAAPLPPALAGSEGKRMYDVGVTGLVLLTFLAAGHEPNDGGPYAAPIAKGLSWLVAQQDPEGCLGPRTTQHYVYNHSTAALALVEAFATTGDPKTLAAAQRALDFSMLARNPYLAWRYGVRPGDNDTSASAWMVLGLAAAWYVNEAAAAAGRADPFRLPPLRPPEDHPFVGALAWVDKMTEARTGRVGYVTRGVSPARPQAMVERFPVDRSEAGTAAGLLIRLLLPAEVPRGKDEPKHLARGFALLDQMPVKWSPGEGTIDLYYWHYASLVMTLRGGEPARAYDKALVTVLSANQRSDGNVCDVQGSWDAADPWGEDGGRTYSTAMALLALTAPGRLSRAPVDPKEVASELAAQGLPAGRAKRLLETAAFHRLPGLEAATLPWASSADEDVRAAAVNAMARVASSAKSGALLVKALSDPSPKVRTAAARLVAELVDPDPSLLGPLQALLKQPDVPTRIAAARALARFGPAASSMLGDLTTMAAEGDPLSKVAAAEAMTAIEPTSAPALVVLAGALRAPDAAARRDAARVAVAHQSTDADFVAALRPVLDDADPTTAAYAAIALRRRSVEDPRLPARLGGGLAARSRQLVAAALVELSALGPLARAALPEVAEQAHRGPRVVRVAATETLAKVGGIDAVAHLCALRADGVPEVRQRAEEAVARLALSAPALAEALATRLLVGAQEDERRGARAGLLAAGPAAVPALGKVLETPGTTPANLVLALEIAAELGEAAKALLPQALRLLSNASEPPVIRTAAEALGRMGVATPEVVAPLKARVLHDDASVAHAAMGAIADLAARSADVALVFASLLGDPAVPEPTRIAGVRAAGRAGPNAPTVLPTLFDLLALPEDNKVRAAAVRAVAQLGEHGMKPIRDVVAAGREPPLKGVLEALALMKERALPALPELIARLLAPIDPGSLTVRATAAIGSAAVKPLLKALPKARNREARFVRVFGEMGPAAKDAIPFLEKMSRSSDFDLALAAREAIAKVKGPG